MTDKVRLIKEEIEYRLSSGKYSINSKQALEDVIDFIDSLPEESASEDLIEEIDKIWKTCNPIDEGMGVEIANIHIEQFDYIARHFVEWQKQQMMKDVVELHIIESFNPVGTENEKPHGFTALCYNAKYPDFYPVTGQKIKVIPTKEAQQ